jgi:hypothetical protein
VGLSFDHEWLPVLEAILIKFEVIYDLVTRTLGGVCWKDAKMKNLVSASL